jgi:uncharacterized protein YifE (UPF0438 family)
MSLQYVLLIRDPEQQVGDYYEIKADFILHKWTTLDKHGATSMARNVQSELEVGREWKIIKTQKNFWAICNDEKIETSALHTVFQDHSKFSMRIELRKSVIQGSIYMGTTATLDFVAQVRVFKAEQLDYYAINFKIIGTTVEKDEPE